MGGEPSFAAETKLRELGPQMRPIASIAAKPPQRNTPHRNLMHHIPFEIVTKFCLTHAGSLPRFTEEGVYDSRIYSTHLL